MLVERVRKVALIRKPYRQSNLCNRSVPHSEKRLRSLDPLRIVSVACRLTIL